MKYIKHYLILASVVMALSPQTFSQKTRLIEEIKEDHRIYHNDIGYIASRILAGLNVGHGDVINSISGIYQPLNQPYQSYNPNLNQNHQGRGQVSQCYKDRYFVSKIETKTGNYYGKPYIVKMDITLSRVSDLSVYSRCSFGTGANVYPNVDQIPWKTEYDYAEIGKFISSILGVVEGGHVTRIDLGYHNHHQNQDRGNYPPYQAVEDPLKNNEHFQYLLPYANTRGQKLTEKQILATAELQRKRIEGVDNLSSDINLSDIMNLLLGVAHDGNNLTLIENGSEIRQLSDDEIKNVESSQDHSLDLDVIYGKKGKELPREIYDSKEGKFNISNFFSMGPRHEETIDRRSFDNPFLASLAANYMLLHNILVDKIKAWYLPSCDGYGDPIKSAKLYTTVIYHLVQIESLKNVVTEEIKHKYIYPFEKTGQLTQIPNANRIQVGKTSIEASVLFSRLHTFIRDRVQLRNQEVSILAPNPFGPLPNRLRDPNIMEVLVNNKAGAGDRELPDALTNIVLPNGQTRDLAKANTLRTVQFGMPYGEEIDKTFGFTPIQIPNDIKQELIKEGITKGTPATLYYLLRMEQENGKIGGAGGAVLATQVLNGVKASRLKHNEADLKCVYDNVGQILRSNSPTRGIIDFFNRNKDFLQKPENKFTSPESAFQHRSSNQHGEESQDNSQDNEEKSHGGFKQSYPDTWQNHGSNNAIQSSPIRTTPPRSTEDSVPGRPSSHGGFKQSYPSRWQN